MENCVGLGWTGGMVPEGFHTKESLPLSKQARTLIIGIAGKARHGKNTVAEEMAKGNMTVKVWGFADALKIEVFDWLHGFNAVRMCDFPVGNDHLLQNNWPVPHGDAFIVEDKIAFINHFKTEQPGWEGLRPLLQKWGTEYRRDQDPEYWINKLFARIRFENPQIVVIPDARFKNELSVCDVTVLVNRLGYHEGDASIGAHVSETELDGEEFDYVIQADDGDVDGLKEKARKVFGDIQEKYLTSSVR